MSQGELFIVATPIGNLGDITLRAIETLRQCDRVAAEDTRRSRALLQHLGISGKPVDSLHAHSSARDVDALVSHLEAGENVAFVTDAGTPAVSDPGSALVRAALERGVRVVPIPGPSAVLAALVGSGLVSDVGFRFMGFLPREGPPRREALLCIADTPEPVVVFEAKGRVQRSLRDLADATPDREACVARELTKVHEEFVRGSLRELAELEREWIGEVAIVLGRHEPQDRLAATTDDDLDARIDQELAAGARAKEIAERLSAWSGRSKRDVYQRVLDRRGK